MSGALKLTKFILAGLEVDADQMRRNIDLTHGLGDERSLDDLPGLLHRARIGTRSRL